VVTTKSLRSQEEVPTYGVHGERRNPCGARKRLRPS
jgi:hypothetical protein